MEKEKEIAQQIRDKINYEGGVNMFSYSCRGIRNSARPTRFNLINELQSLSDEELNVAFQLGLIGNNNRNGSIVKKSCKS